MVTLNKCNTLKTTLSNTIQLVIAELLIFCEKLTNSLQHNYVMIMIMIMIRYWKDSTQCWLHPGGGGTLKTKRGLITTNLVQKYNY